MPAQNTLTDSKVLALQTMLAPVTESDLLELELALFRRIASCHRHGSLYVESLAVAADYLGLDHPCEGEDFAQRYFLQQAMRKNPRLPHGKTGDERHDAAVAKFWEAETKNAETNQRIAGGQDDRFTELLGPVRRLLTFILGDLKPETLGQVYLHMAPGKGGTTTVKGEVNDSWTKYAGPWAGTPRLLACMPPEAWPCATTTDGCDQTLQTVPKDAKVNRTILKQPDCNIAFQRAVGQLLRSRMAKRTPIQPSQQTRNRRACAVAVRRGYATIDLSSASDTISKGLVTTLFDTPILHKWLHLLFLGRADVVLRDDGSKHILEMWSSMGNGYTWELETLVFYALIRTLVPNEFPVYTFGDDMLVPGEYLECVVDALNTFGFKVNTSKSFYSGGFRESCGWDFYYGKPVRPFYLRMKWFDGLTFGEVATHYHNALSDYIKRVSWDHSWSSALLRVRKQFIVDYVGVEAYLMFLGLHGQHDEGCFAVSKARLLALRGLDSSLNRLVPSHRLRRTRPTEEKYDSVLLDRWLYLRRQNQSIDTRTTIPVIEPWLSRALGHFGITADLLKLWLPLISHTDAVVHAKGGDPGSAHCQWQSQSCIEVPVTGMIEAKRIRC